jgi:DNA-binding response OmpR family regulator
MTEAITVLVVEDDHLIRDMIEDVFSEGGLETVITRSGDDAIALLKDNNCRYRAIVTDINLLGRLDGWDVARVSREMDPTMPVVYMTGAHGREWPSKGVPQSVLLQKPFIPAQIVAAVATLLNSSPRFRPKPRTANLRLPFDFFNFWGGMGGTRS